MSLPQIVIIDDEKLNLDGIEMLIKQAQLPVKVIGKFQSSTVALDYLDKNHADIILTDIKMPKINGLELIEQLRKKSILSEIIIITGFGTLAYAQKAMTFGIKYFLEKPISAPNLIKTIENSISDLHGHQQGKLLLKKELLENSLSGNTCLENDIGEFTIVVFQSRYRSLVHDMVEQFFQDAKFEYCSISSVNSIIYCVFSSQIES